MEKLLKIKLIWELGNKNGFQSVCKQILRWTETSGSSEALIALGKVSILRVKKKYGANENDLKKELIVIIEGLGGTKDLEGSIDEVKIFFISKLSNPDNIPFVLDWILERANSTTGRKNIVHITSLQKEITLFKVRLHVVKKSESEEYDTGKLVEDIISWIDKLGTI